MEIGDRIRYRRKELGITQTQLAKAMGYSDKSSISLLESNRIDLSTKQLLSACEALRTTVWYILGVEPEYVEKVELDGLVKAYQRADRETQLVVRRILNVKKEDVDSLHQSVS